MRRGARHEANAASRFLRLLAASRRVTIMARTHQTCVVNRESDVMKKLVYCTLAAAALAVGVSNAALAANNGKPSSEGNAPASSTAALSASPQAFPNSTTIYIVPNVLDNGGAALTGISTVVGCTNVSGVAV